MWNNYLPILFIVVLLPLLSSCLYSQKDSTAFQPSLQMGVQYGTSWNTVQFSPVVQQENFAGQRIALAMRYTSDPHLGVQVEAAYDKRGWAETNDSLISNYTREIDYIELAFFTHISIGNRLIRPVILLGSFLSYPIKEKETYPSEWAELPSLPFYYGQNLPKRLQFGLTGGLGFEFVFNRFSLHFDGRYRSALGGIFSTKKTDNTIDNNLIFSNSQGFTAQVTGLFSF